MTFVTVVILLKPLNLARVKIVILNHNLDLVTTIITNTVILGQNLAHAATRTYMYSKAKFILDNHGFSGPNLAQITADTLGQNFTQMTTQCLR